MQPEGICPVRFLFPICVVRTDCQCAGNAAAVSTNRSAAPGLGKACRRIVSVCAGAVKKGAACGYLRQGGGCRLWKCGRAVRHGCLAGDAVLYAAAVLRFQRLLRYGARHCAYAWHGASGELRFPLQGVQHH